MKKAIEILLLVFTMLLVGCGSTNKGKMKTDFSVIGNYANISQQGEYALGDHAIAYAKSTSAQQTLYL